MKEHEIQVQFQQQKLTKPLLNKQKQNINSKQIKQDQQKSNQNLNNLKKNTVKHQYSKNNMLQAKNYFSYLFFSFISSFAAYGNQFQLSKQNIPILSQKQMPYVDYKRLSTIFKQESQNNTGKRQGIILSKAMAKAYSKDFFLLFLQTILFVGFSMYAPIITDQIINYIQQGAAQKQLTKGISLFIGVLFLNFFKILAQSHVFYKFGIIGFNLSNTLSLLLYEKSLKHPVLCLKKYSSSDIINYSQIDAQRMTYMGFQLSAILFTPIQVLIGLWLMYNFIGISFLSGIGVMILTIGLTFIFSKISIKLNQNLLKAKDQRMKLTEQIFSIIRFIKINAFQKYFWQKLNTKRQNQLNLNKKKLTFQILTIFVYWLASPLILSLTFATYIWLGNQMSATEAFTTIMLFRILQYPIRLLPTAISEIIQIWTSVKRLQKFLLSQQMEQKCIKRKNQKDQIAIRITNGTFAWGKQKQQKNQKQKDKNENLKKNVEGSLLSNQASILQQESSLQQSLLKLNQDQENQLTQKSPQQKLKDNQKNKQKQEPVFVKALKDINFEIQSGKFTMIIGDIGSGKSSLLFAILNQMKPSKQSKIQINGSIAYVPQKPWIMTASLKDNITFTQQYIKEKFQEVAKYSCIKTDIQLLIDGQNTQIGQKGTNLSGGQKARVALARALYSNRDIYLLDDIISAVDVHVGQFLIKQTILKYLKNKTVIMPSHAIKFANFADNIIIMKKGKIIKYGSYNKIKQSQQFKQLYQTEAKKQIQQTQSKNSKSKQQQKKILEDLLKIKNVKEQKQKKQKQHLQQVANESQKNIKKSLTQKIVQQLILPQDHKKGQITLDIYKQYMDLNGGYIFVFILFFCMTMWLSLSTFSNIWMQKWCQDPDQGNQFLYIFLALSISSSIFMLFRARTLVIGGIICGSKVHKKITKALLYASLNKFYNRVPLGRIFNRLSKDLRQIDQAIGYSVGNFLVSGFSLAGTLIITIYASSYFIIIPMIIVAYICNRFRLYYMKTQRQCVRLENITSSPIVSGFLSAINGLQTIRAYNLQDKFLKLQIDKIQQNKRLRITRQTLESWFCQRLSFITFFINMTAIGYCMLSSNQNPSLAGLLLTYALTLNDDIIDTIFAFTYLQTKMVSVQRVNNFMEIEAEEGYKKYTQKWRTKQEGYNDVIKYGEIKFMNAKVKYRQELPQIIKGISIEIKSGQKIGIVGRTGAGKSTIINCLLRILDCSEGKILIDGVDIKDYFLKDLRYNITMIDQQPIIINGTLRQNLNPTKKYSTEELQKIIEQCNLSEIVKQKGGLDSKVANDSLSVGQKQLICICRAFLKCSKIVLIDEATANIDQKNDQLIQQVISNKFKNSTVLTIAHRLSTLQKSDKILVLGQGKILQWGNPQELLKKENGVYKEMLMKGNMKSQFLM